MSSAQFAARSVIGPGHVPIAPQMLSYPIYREPEHLEHLAFHMLTFIRKSPLPEHLGESPSFRANLAHMPKMLQMLSDCEHLARSSGPADAPVSDVAVARPDGFLRPVGPYTWVSSSRVHLREAATHRQESRQP